MKSTVNNLDKRVSKEKALSWVVLRNRYQYQVLILQLKTKNKVKKIVLYQINTRELNKVLSIMYLSYICQTNSLYYINSSLF